MFFVSLAPGAKAKCMSGRCPTTETSNEGNVSKMASSLKELRVRDRGSLRKHFNKKAKKKRSIAVDRPPQAFFELGETLSGTRLVYGEKNTVCLLFWSHGLCVPTPSRSQLLRECITHSGDSRRGARLDRLVHKVPLSRWPGRRLLGGQPSGQLLPPQKL